MRRFAGRLPRLVRRIIPDPALRALRNRLERLRPRPVISVIIPVYDVERYVADCLDSILLQDLGSFEVLAVDDGSTDTSAEIVEVYARRDRRVRLLRQEHAGQGPARNLAIGLARGEFLVFVDADDLVLPGSFRYLVRAMRRSGSDFAVPGVRRHAGDRTFRPSWTVVVHEHDRVAITIDDFPAALADVIVHRIVRTSFWRDRIGGFGSGIYEDHVPMVAAYLRARTFDLLARVTYEWRLRDEGTSTGQRKHELGNLATRISVKAEARELVWHEASPAVRAAWVGRVLNIDFPPYVERGLTATDEYRRTLQDALAGYIDLATPEALRYVRVRQKIRTYLASVGDWGGLAQAETVFEELGSIPPTVIQDGSVRLARSPLDGTATAIPGELLELGQSESRLQVCLSGCETVGGSTLRLTGWAVIRAVDLAVRTPSIRLTLVSDTGQRLNLPVVLVATREATKWVNWPHGSFANAGFQVDIDLSRLVIADARSTAWRLFARVEVDGLMREDGVHHAAAGSSASRAALVGRRVRLGSLRIEPTFDPEHGFTILVPAE